MPASAFLYLISFRKESSTNQNVNDQDCLKISSQGGWEVLGGRRMCGEKDRNIFFPVIYVKLKVEDALERKPWAQQSRLANSCATYMKEQKSLRHCHCHISRTYPVKRNKANEAPFQQILPSYIKTYKNEKVLANKAKSITHISTGWITSLHDLVKDELCAF